MRVAAFTNHAAASTDVGRGTTASSSAACDAHASSNTGSVLELLPASCWSLVASKLAARDLLCVSITSKAISCLLSNTPGLWSQACSSCIGWLPPVATPAANTTCSSTAAVYGQQQHDQPVGFAPPPLSSLSSSIPAAPAAPAAADADHDADLVAHRVLAAFTAVAHATLGLKPQLKPQSYPLPPWLGVQPGSVRGFVRVDGSALNPPLVLTEAQLHWFSFGCFSGHAGGVFTSACSSSLRSQQPCGFMAAVVINKALLAELYLPGRCTSPDRWAGLTSPPPAAAAAAAAAGGRVEVAAATAAAAALDVELWVSPAVSLHQAEAGELSESTAAVVAGGGAGRGRQRNRGSRGVRSNSSSGSGSGSGAVTWNDVHQLLMQAVSDNAARGRAVHGTAVVPPGTAAAAEMESRLGQLIAAGAPVMDLRRFRYSYQEQTAAAAGREESRQQQQQQPMAGAAGSSRNARRRRAAAAAATPSVVTAAGSRSAGLPGNGQQQQQQQQQQQWSRLNDAVQAAISTAVIGKLAANSSNSTAGHGMTPVSNNVTNNVRSTGEDKVTELDDDSMADVVAAVVQQLPQLAPQLQLLVLPVLLPGGRVGQKLPSSRAGGGRLSAPRLLSLNVPFLVPMRHAWDKLPCLRQVLLIPGSPPPLPPPSLQQQQQQQQQLPQLGHGGLGYANGSSGAAAAGGACGAHGVVLGESGHTCASPGGAGRQSDAQLCQQLQLQQQGSGGADMVRGVFSQQQLEHQWQQQMQIHWDEDAEDAWFQQQQQQQQQLSGLMAQPVLQSTTAAVTQQGCWTAAATSGTSRMTGAAASSSSGSGSSTAAALPGYALEAVQGMVLSCMDRLALNNAGDGH